MQYTSNTTGLQQAAQQFCLRRELRVSGAFMLVFGALALMGGLVPPPNFALLAVGMVLFATAITNIAMPSPAGIVFTGIALVLVGAFNIGSSIFDGQGSASAGAWPVIGVWQIVWGVQAFGRYRQYPAQSGPAPSDAERTQAREWVNALRKANPRKQNDVIEMTNTNALDPKRVRIQLMPAQALVLINQGQDARVVPSDRLSVQAPPPSGKSGHVKVTLRAGDYQLEGPMSQEHLERYQQWKSATTAPRVEPLARAA